MRCVRRLCCLLPRQVLPSCAWCRMCCALTLCHRHPALVTGTQPLAPEMFQMQPQASDIRTSIFLLLPWHFLFLTADVPALPFAKGLKGFCVSVLSLCHFSWINPVHVGLCSSVRRVWGCATATAFPLTPTFLLVPCCSPAVQDSDLLTTPAS